MDNRKAFNFYRSYWEQIKLLTKTQQLDIFNAVCSVQFMEINIEDITFTDKISNLVWIGIRHSILTSLKGYVSKQKGLDKVVNIPLSKGLSKGGAAPPMQEEQVQEQVQVQEEEQYVNRKNPILTAHEFYKNEIQKNEKESNIKQYIQFYGILSGNNSVNEELSGILSMENQVNYKAFCNLLKKSIQNNKKFSTILPSMDNDRKYYNKKSLSRTIHTWLNNEF